MGKIIFKMWLFLSTGTLQTGFHFNLMTWENIVLARLFVSHILWRAGASGGGVTQAQRVNNR